MRRTGALLDRFTPRDAPTTSSMPNALRLLKDRALGPVLRPIIDCCRDAKRALGGKSGPGAHRRRNTQHCTDGLLRGGGGYLSRRGKWPRSADSGPHMITAPGEVRRLAVIRPNAQMLAAIRRARPRNATPHASRTRARRVPSGGPRLALRSDPAGSGNGQIRLLSA
jgi:hypothetical protein